MLVFALVKSQNQQKINQDLIMFKDELLGSGAFGAVFKGSYKGGPCAVKLLLHDVMKMREDIEVGKNETACVAFERECRFLKSCEHPNIVQYLSTARLLIQVIQYSFLSSWIVI